MENKIHPDYIKASNLIFWSVAIIVGGSLIAGTSIDIIIFSAIFYGVLGLLTRIGIKQIKTVMIVYLALDVIGLLSGLFQNGGGFVILTTLANEALRVWALVIVWKIPASAQVGQQTETPAEADEAPVENEQASEDTLES